MRLILHKEKYIPIAEISIGIAAIAAMINKTTKIPLVIKPEPLEVIKATAFLIAGQIISLELLYNTFE